MPNTSLSPATKSRLTIESFAKVGTHVDGVEIENETPHELKNDSHDIQLGHFQGHLRITWVPVCMALTYIAKKNEGQYQDLKEKLESCDIRVTKDLDETYTTHVVASKRNTAATLEALAHGVYVVTGEFVDKILEVTTPIRAGITETDTALLEKNYDEIWPNTVDYVPPAGKEPIVRPAKMYLPKVERQTVFRGYTFIVCLQRQLDNLLAPITAGGGKVKLYDDFKIGLTEVDEFVAYVKKLAGEIGIGELRGTGPGVVVVRISGDDDWAQQFVQRTDLLLGQRSILQNEFLDPILTNDARVMRQSLEEEDSASSAVPNEALANGIGLIPSTAPEAGQKLVGRARRARYGRVKSRFKGFDTFDDMPEPVAPPLQENCVDEDVDMQESRPFPVDEQNTDTTPTKADLERKKRAIGASGLDEIRPTAAEVKRRRIAAGIEDVSQASVIGNAIKEEPIKQKPKLFTRTIIKRSVLQLAEEPAEKIDSDLRKVVDAERELQEEKARAARVEDEMTTPLTAEELEAIRNQIQYGEIKVRDPNRAKTPRNAAGGAWDDRWNGRQNYKKFRRKGQGHDQPLRVNRVIVPLTPSEVNDNPLGSVRWSTTTAPTSKRSKKASRLSKFRPANDDTDDESEEDNSQFRRRATVAEVEYAMAMAEILSDAEEGIEVSKDLGHVPNRGVIDLGGNGDASIITATSTTQADSMQSSAQSKTKKRPSDRSMAAPPAKRQAVRKALASASDSDSSGDDLRFKFSSKAKRK